ncbi:metal ABC transporter ATP-binding protein [Mycetocola tolaasinivorans]|uniref:Metal ABC transporter ATP-binding protein n=1 Tax=Mycetocola tolaasinivorans TaxID=76635 RepID=A0A3L7A5K3_9MICO|nr:metal ABC transporter ATP-binding protein [Mycetocola tolaasinivorans]
MSVRDLHVSYGSVIALSGVNLELPAGSIVGLVGMNGSGKSTLFSALIGTIPGARGTVRILGRESARARAENLVAFVPQTEVIDRDFPISVREVVMLGRYGRLGFTRRPRAADHAAVKAALARVGLTELAERPIGALSGGQRKRAFVARGIVQDARVLLLDEPFGGVDATSQALIIRVLKELRDEGRSLLVATHDLAGIPDLCDEVLLLNRRVLFHGDPATALLPENLALTFGVAP